MSTEEETMIEGLRQELDDLEREGGTRTLKELGGSGKWVEYEGRKMLNLSSNDYMRYASDADLVGAFYADMDAENLLNSYGPGSSSSRLLTGNHPGYSRLEESLESLYGRPALTFSSGYHANIGILPTLAQSDDLILLDKLVHSSILDGARLSGAKWQRFRHRDMAHLRKLLELNRADYRRVFVVTESIFSMDGDMADIPALVDLKKEFDLLLYLDEAHAVGTRGPHGLGMADEAGLLDDIDMLVGTFGKALGSLGAFVICDAVVKQYLVNRSRSFIFTTALPPVTVHWNRWIMEKMVSDRSRRQDLDLLADRLREELRNAGIDTSGDSHIVPALVGESKAAVDLACRLREKGFLLFPIRPPTVPPGTARLRFSLSADMEWDDLAGVVELLMGHRE